MVRDGELGWEWHAAHFSLTISHNYAFGCTQWREHIELAVARGQRLQVVFFESHKGQGKVEWDDCAEVARRRSSLGARRQQFFESLPNAEQTRLRKANDSDEQEQLFRASLPAADRRYSVVVVLSAFSRMTGGSR